MKKKIVSYLILLSVLLNWSCVEDLNFDRTYQVTPNLESSLLYLETEESLINQSPGINYYSQEYVFEAFDPDFISENLLEGTIFYEIENTTSKPLEILLEFLDAGGAVLDTETFSVAPAPAAMLERQTLYGGAGGRNIDIIRNTVGFRLTATNLGDNTSTSSLPEPKVIFRSMAQFRIQLQ